MNKKPKRAVKPLLVAGTGIALLSFGASACFPTGNLMGPPRCDAGAEYDYQAGACQPVEADGGSDAGADSDGGTP